jgi:hypothetical protein
MDAGVEQICASVAGGMQACSKQHFASDPGVLAQPLHIAQGVTH